MIVKGQKMQKEYLWDFAVDGGATGALSLQGTTPDGDAMPEGFHVEKVTISVETAVTSGGTPTITVGPTVDSDGYLADVFALVGTAPVVVRSGEVAGALLWDDTNDHEITYRVGSAANTKDVVLQIGTAALTAGKIRVLVEGTLPSARAAM